MARKLKNNIELVYLAIIFAVGFAVALGPMLKYELSAQAPGARYYANPAAADQGAAGARTISSLASAIGTTRKATIVLPKLGSGTTEEYLFSTAWDGSAYANIIYEIEQGAEIRVDTGVSGVTVYSPANIKAQPGQQIVSGVSLYFANAGGTASVRWFGANPDGSGDDNSSIQAALNSMKGGGDLLFPSGPSYYTTSATLISGNTNTKLSFEKGAELWVSGVSITSLRLSAGYQTVDGGTFSGYGLFNTNTNVPLGTNAVALISAVSDHATIRNCILKNGEQTFIEVNADNATIENNIFKGGPVFSASFSDRQHEAILFRYYADNGIVRGNRIVAGDDGGMPIEGIVCQRSRNMIIENNHFNADYDHAIYCYLDGSVVSNNIVKMGGIKVLMRPYGNDYGLLGNVITGNFIDVSGSAGVLNGDGGIILNDPNWTVVSKNIVQNTQDAGIQISLSTGIVSRNIITDNVIMDVQPSGGDHAIGINIESSGITEFSFNVIARNIIDSVNFQSGVTVGTTVDINAGIGIIDIENNTNHIGNVISDNVISNISETGIYLRYLSKSLVANNTIYNIGTALGGDSGIYLRSSWDNTVANNNVISDNSLNYLFREQESSTTNFYLNNFGSGTTSQITGHSSTSKMKSDNVVIETLTAKKTIKPGEATVYVLNPGGSNRIVEPSGVTWPYGYEITIVNPTNGTNWLSFQTVGGVIHYVSGSSEFIYSGATWYVK